jgi:hypothetical protein
MGRTDVDALLALVFRDAVPRREVPDENIPPE